MGRQDSNRTGDEGVTDLDEANRASPLEKVFAVLEVMGTEARPMMLGELASALGLPKATTHRITAQLERLGYLQREPGSRFLVVAPRLVRLGLALVGTSTRTGVRHEILRELARRIGESVVLGVRVGNEVAYLDDVTEDSYLTIKFRAGLRAPLHCTSMGKLYLARMSPAEWQQFVSRPLESYTERTITDPIRLRKEVDRVAEQDFATSNQEFVRGIVGSAAPIYVAKRRMVAAVSISAPAVRMTVDELRELRAALEETAAALAKTFAFEQLDSSARYGP